MRTQQIKFHRQYLQKELPRKLLHRQHINKQSTPPQSLYRQCFQYRFSSSNGSTDDHNIWMLFTQVVRIIEEQNP
ncbi:hypothetical protein Scep_008321 [Stephania cephalantha]|uniref:Uncharacterized protein n=1 Tax=Stephania cephalantha TaxID=152367 RepID=A0AAP0KDJ2_9MAGN